MSDIWHERNLEIPATDNKPKVDRSGYPIYWTAYGWSHPAPYSNHRIGCQWAYVDDLLACEQELDRTRKALDVAIDAMKKSNEIVYSAYGSPLKTLKDTLEQINKITKGGKDE